ncbi:hypothetical protein [Kaarinaea lacus]
MKSLHLFVVLAMFFTHAVLAKAVFAKENPACQDQQSSYINSSATELRDIAATCEDKAIARLFYNRAYHKYLLSEGKALSGMILYNSEASDYQLTAYRLYIAMVEELAPLYYPDVRQRIEFLNTVYERRSEVVELRLKGNDRLADALERKMLF